MLILSVTCVSEHANTMLPHFLCTHLVVGYFTPCLVSISYYGDRCTNEKDAKKGVTLHTDTSTLKFV